MQQSSRHKWRNQFDAVWLWHFWHDTGAAGLLIHDFTHCCFLTDHAVTNPGLFKQQPDGGLSAKLWREMINNVWRLRQFYQCNLVRRQNTSLTFCIMIHLCVSYKYRNTQLLKNMGSVTFFKCFLKSFFCSPTRLFEQKEKYSNIWKYYCTLK